MAIALDLVLPSTTSKNIVCSVIGTASVGRILLGIRELTANDRVSWHLVAANRGLLHAR